MNAARIHYLALLVLLVPLCALAIRKYIVGKREFIFLAGEWREKETSSLYARKSLTVSVCSLLAFVFAVLALAGFQAGERIVADERLGNSTVIVLDISNSMRCEDIKPSRLAYSISAIDRLVDQAGDNSFGLVIFKGRASAVWPLSEDREAIRLFLGTVETGYITSPGTNIGSAIEAGLGLFSVPGRHCAIILFTDGENLSGDPLLAASLAAEMGVAVFPVIVGTERGAFVPGDAGGYVKDVAGVSIVSRTDERVLGEVARVTGGRLFRYDGKLSIAPKLASIARETGANSPETGFRTVRYELYSFFLAVSLLFLAAWFMAKGTRWNGLL